LRIICDLVMLSNLIPVGFVRCSGIFPQLLFSKGVATPHSYFVWICGMETHIIPLDHLASARSRDGTSKKILFCKMETRYSQQ